MPFGGKRGEGAGITSTAYKFTDQELDKESGLYNYDARLYDPIIGRFISADPYYSPNLNTHEYYFKLISKNNKSSATMVGAPMEQQKSQLDKNEFGGYFLRSAKLDRYAYVSNNPVNGIDPYGLSEIALQYYSSLLLATPQTQAKREDIRRAGNDLAKVTKLFMAMHLALSGNQAAAKILLMDESESGSDAGMDLGSGGNCPNGDDDNNKGKWKTPEEWAEHVHKRLRDQLRKEQSGFESGRHDQFPSAMRDALSRLADLADKRGDLPEYGKRLRQIANTYAKRAGAAHRGGW
jgi:RHS repeat-associated protein